MTPLLVVLNPRNIPQCMEAFRTLPIRKAYIRNLSERNIADFGWGMMLDQAQDADPIIVVSDDALVSQAALETVLRLLEDHPVATGWCPLSERHKACNLSDNVLPQGPPSRGSYNFLWVKDVKGQVTTTFAGMCLTGMSREMWERFPFDAYGDTGYASDYSLSVRLQDAGVPIVSHEDARCEHIKATWNEHDPRWRMFAWDEPGVVFE